MATHVDHERYDFVWDQTEESRRLPPCRTRALPKGAFKGAQAGRLCSFWGEASLGRAATIFPRSHERLTECSDDWDC